MSSNQLWGPEEDIPDLISDDSEEEEALVARPPRAPRPDAEALLTLGVSLLTCAQLYGARLSYNFMTSLSKSRCCNCLSHAARMLLHAQSSVSNTCFPLLSYRRH